MKVKEMEDNMNRVEKSKKFLQDVSNGVYHQMGILILEGLELVQAQKGFVLCNFTVSDRISDADGNWHVGAMAILIDTMAGAAVCSFSGQVKATIDLSISYYSTAKIQEQVEITARVVAERQRIASVVTEVRRKDNGELIAVGKQWMGSNGNAFPASKL